MEDSIIDPWNPWIGNQGWLQDEAAPPDNGMAADGCRNCRIELLLSGRTCSAPGAICEMFRTLVEASPDVIVCYDVQGRRIYVNPSYEREFGAANQALGKTALTNSRFPLELAARVHEMVGAAFNEGRGRETTLAWADFTGEDQCFHLRVMPQMDQSGRAVGVLGFLRNVSHIQRTERELAEVEGMANLGHWLWRADTGTMTVSAAVCRIFGRPPDWAPGLKDVLRCIVREDRAWIRTALNVAYAAGAPDASFDFKIVVGGRNKDVHSSARICYVDGRPVSLDGVVQDVTQVKGIQEKLHALTYYDRLTQLPNRDLFLDRLRQAVDQSRQRNRQVCVMIVDLDNFGSANEALGYAAGDQILREVAIRLLQCVRAGDTVARLTGDEFGLVLADIPQEADLHIPCRAVLAALDRPYPVEGQEIFLGASIGVAHFPDDGQSVSVLMQHADSAMSHAQDSGRNRYEFYSPELTAQAAERMALVAGLCRAEANGELELYYQPQVELATGRLVGAEALLRWNHPEQGLLSPDRFIRLAEETGLIVGIGEWVFRTACETARAWNVRGQRPLRVAVNLSVRQFQEPGLAEMLEAVLVSTGCSPAWIEVEITESLLLEDSTDVLETLDRFKALGMHIAIDDFGTGYSALGYLIRYPVKTIKIDRSFTRDIGVQRGNTELVRAIISLSKSLDMNVVAEGVEEPWQQEFLCDHGCRLGQGYLFGKPMPREIFEAGLLT